MKKWEFQYWKHNRTIEFSKCVKQYEQPQLMKRRKALTLSFIWGLLSRSYNVLDSIRFITQEQGRIRSPDPGFSERAQNSESGVFLGFEANAIWIFCIHFKEIALSGNERVSHSYLISCAFCLPLLRLTSGLGPLTNADA